MDFRRLFQELLDWVYPPLCRLCKEESKKSICSLCMEALSWIDPPFRCSYCFCEVEVKVPEPFCSTCHKERDLPFRRAYLFEEEIRAFQLLSLLKRKEEVSLLKFAASLITVQLMKLNMPLFEEVLIFPEENHKRVLIGMIEALSAFLPCRISRASLKKTYTGFLKTKIVLKDGLEIEGKKILLFGFQPSLDDLKEVSRSLKGCSVFLYTLLQPKNEDDL